MSKNTIIALLLALVVSTALAKAEPPPDERKGDDVKIAVQVGAQIVKKAISLWHSWNDSHPCVMVEPDGKTYYVPLIPSKESRGSYNFSQEPFRAENNGGKDNGIIRVEFVNFGRFTKTAHLQVKVDKHHNTDRNRGHVVGDGEETDIGIGASIRGFYFAIRGDVNTETILKEYPNAYVKVTIVRKPA